MEHPLVAHASVVIAAPPSAVWSTLLAPETLPRIMPVSEVVAPWARDGEFVWRTEMQGALHTVEGRVLRLEPERVLEYDFVDPHARALRGITNRHRVTIELGPEDGATRVSLAHDNNQSRAAWAHAEGGWRLALNNLKALVEGTRQA